MADRIVVLRGGNIEQIGAPLDLYDRPANVFVAGFIGSPSMNLFDGVARSGRIEALGTSLPIPDGLALTEGQQVTYGIRPEHLTLADTGIPCTVGVIEPTGSETHVVVRAAGQEITGLFRERHAFKPGQPLHLLPDPNAAHLFDRQSGLRIG